MSRLGLAISVVFAVSVLVESRQCGDAGLCRGWCDKECCGNATDGMKCLDNCTGQSCLSDSECGKKSCCGDDRVCSGKTSKCLLKKMLKTKLCRLKKMLEKSREKKPCSSNYDCENGCCSNGKCHKKGNIFPRQCSMPCSENSNCSESNCCVNETCQLFSIVCKDFKIPPFGPLWPHLVIPTYESNDGGNGGSYSSGNGMGAGWIVLIIFGAIFKVFVIGYYCFRRRPAPVIVVPRQCPAPVVGAASPLPAPTYSGSYEPGPGIHVIDMVMNIDEDHLKQKYERRQDEDSTSKTEENNSPPCGPPPMYSA